MEVGYLHHLFSSIITGKDGNVVKSSDVKASGLRLPVISENGKSTFKLKSDKEWWFRIFRREDGGNSSTVQPMGIDSKKYDSETMHVDRPGVLMMIMEVELENLQKTCRKNFTKTACFTFYEGRQSYEGK